MKIAIRRKLELRACKRCEKPYPTIQSRCPSCGHWDSPVSSMLNADETVLLSEVSDSPLKYIQNTGPWDPCFSHACASPPRCQCKPKRLGGIVTVSVTLLGGGPGAGKSTLALQISDRIAEVTGKEIIYVGAEEAKEQIKDRALRLKVKNMSLLRVYPMGASSDLGAILTRRKPAAIIVDSLPGLIGDPEQAVELAKRFKEYAVTLEAPVILIDHITKDDEFAGFMALQHEVDTTMQFTKYESDDPSRILETVKNRFGDSISVPLEMTGEGLIAGSYDDEDDEDDE